MAKVVVYELQNFANFLSSKGFDNEEKDLNYGNPIEEALHNLEEDPKCCSYLDFSYDFDDIEDAEDALDELERTTTWKDLMITEYVYDDETEEYDYEDENIVYVTEFMEECLKCMAVNLEENGHHENADYVFGLLATLDEDEDDETEEE